MVLTIAASIVLLPALFYQNTGWEQYSYRFSIDALPLLMGAICIGVSRATPLLKAAVIASVVIQGFGALVFGRYESFF